MFRALQNLFDRPYHDIVSSATAPSRTEPDLRLNLYLSSQANGGIQNAKSILSSMKQKLKSESLETRYLALVALSGVVKNGNQTVHSVLSSKRELQQWLVHLAFGAPNSLQRNGSGEGRMENERILTSPGERTALGGETRAVLLREIQKEARDVIVYCVALQESGLGRFPYLHAVFTAMRNAAQGDFEGREHRRGNNEFTNSRTPRSDERYENNPYRENENRNPLDSGVSFVDQEEHMSLLHSSSDSPLHTNGGLRTGTSLGSPSVLSAANLDEMLQHLSEFATLLKKHVSTFEDGKSENSADYLEEVKDAQKGVSEDYAKLMNLLSASSLVDQTTQEERQLFRTLSVEQNRMLEEYQSFVQSSGKKPQPSSISKEVSATQISSTPVSVSWEALFKTKGPSPKEEESRPLPKLD